MTANNGTKIVPRDPLIYRFSSSKMRAKAAEGERGNGESSNSMSKTLNQSLKEWNR
jgi:hypothetical protein